MLRVPDTAAGKQAKCPKCQTLASVPGETPVAQPLSPLPAFGPSPIQPAKPAAMAGDNPYATAPMPGGGVMPGPAAVPGEIRNVQVDVSHVISYAFECWKRDIGILVVAVILAGLASSVLTIPAMIIVAILSLNGEEDLAAVVNIGSQIVSLPLQMYFMLGLMNIALASARGQKIDIGMIFYRGGNTIGALVAIVLFGILIAVATLACIAPGIVVIMFYWPFYYLVIDRRDSMGQAFTLARQITMGNVGTSVLIWLCTIGILLLGYAACLVGVLFAYPLVMLIWATAYLMMSGQLQAGQMRKSF
jgi:uncharacterized membrane protein